MISLIFTKSDKIGSKIIRDATNSKSSHMAWMLDDHLIFHSNHEGCHPEWKDRFLKVNEIVFKIDLDLLTLEQEEKLYLEVLKNDGKKYDYGGIYYQGLVWLAQKLNIYIPPVNKWSSKNRKLCLELAEPLNTVFGIVLPKLDFIIPDGLYVYLKQALKDNFSSGG